MAGALALGVLLTVGIVAVVLATAGEDLPGMSRSGRGTSMPRHLPIAGADEKAYLVEMIAHHQEAVEAARQLRRSSRAEMRDLGTSIVTSQSEQIGRMERWLASWYPDEPGGADYQPMMRDLSGLAGDRLDLAFLQDMIPHHMAAIMMSQRLLMRGLAEHPEVTALARSIRDEQGAEILRMRHWLLAWSGERGRGRETRAQVHWPVGNRTAVGRGRTARSVGTNGSRA
ncbi:MAG TPA: DUF305 domain-containing protein [Nocardioides sp.]|uniref:DUF305 domain-containing protein n=1 Tax=Nocardioides sp. TaxID=35761 RepID=UPI002BD707A6|nr:DUF305 domain-containing protein [Nocardioides sp.]HTW13853.1 DUF305 domain-containing protein [Nocardioides sp.]